MWNQRPLRLPSWQPSFSRGFFVLLMTFDFFADFFAAFFGIAFLGLWNEKNPNATRSQWIAWREAGI